jgi:hypothetical protein
MGRFHGANRPSAKVSQAVREHCLDPQARPPRKNREEMSVNK